MEILYPYCHKDVEESLISFFFKLFLLDNSLYYFYITKHFFLFLQLDIFDISYLSYDGWIH